MKFPKKEKPRHNTGLFFSQRPGAVGSAWGECGPRHGPVATGDPGTPTRGASQAPTDAVTAPSAPEVAWCPVGTQRPRCSASGGESTGGAAAVVPSKLSRTEAYLWARAMVRWLRTVTQWSSSMAVISCSNGVEGWGSEVRPSRAKGAAQVELTKMVEGGGGRFRNAVKGGGGLVTDADERSRGEKAGGGGRGEEKGARRRSAFSSRGRRHGAVGSGSLHVPRGGRRRGAWSAAPTRSRQRWAKALGHRRR
jgi:hypothetical protein